LISVKNEVKHNNANVSVSDIYNPCSVLFEYRENIKKLQK